MTEEEMIKDVCTDRYRLMTAARECLFKLRLNMPRELSELCQLVDELHSKDIHQIKELIEDIKNYRP